MAVNPYILLLSAAQSAIKNAKSLPKNTACFCCNITVMLKVMADLQDKVIQCIDCHADFIFTVRDQQFYQEQGFTNEPKRCKKCRLAKKERRESSTRDYKSY